MAQLPLPVGKQEFHDGTNWFSLASEDWVLNTIGNVPPCSVATTANLTATYSNGANGVGATLTNSGSFSPLSVDGFSLAVGNRVLIKNQTSNIENGVYTVTNVGSGAAAWVLTRATDLDFYTQFIRGLTVKVFAGTTNSPKVFMLTSAVSVNIGSAAVVFSELGSSGITITAGNNIVISGSTTNPTVSLSDSVTIPQNLSSLSVITSDGGTFGGQKGINLPKGTTAQRPSSVLEGTVRVNTDPQPTVNVGVVFIPNNIKMTGMGYFGLPAGPSSQRPASPENGYMRINTDV